MRYGCLRCHVRGETATARGICPNRGHRPRSAAAGPWHHETYSRPSPSPGRATCAMPRVRPLPTTVPRQPAESASAPFTRLEPTSAGAGSDFAVRPCSMITSATAGTRGRSPRSPAPPVAQAHVGPSETQIVRQVCAPALHHIKMGSKCRELDRQSVLRAKPLRRSPRPARKGECKCSIRS